jgi:arsenate reductase
MPSDSVNPQVVEVMNEVGLDLSANVPSIITQLQVDDANLVITMGCSVEECPINNFHVDEDWKLEGPTQPAHPRCSQDSRRDQIKGYSFVG